MLHSMGSFLNKQDYAAYLFAEWKEADNEEALCSLRSLMNRHASIILFYEPKLAAEIWREFNRLDA